MSNVDINVDRRMDGRKSGCLYRTLLQAGATKNIYLSPYFFNNKNSAEGVIAPAGAKVTGATIRMWLLNKFISFLAVLTWKTGLKTNVDKVPSGAHIFQASPIPSNGYIFSTDFSYHTAQ